MKEVTMKVRVEQVLGTQVAEADRIIWPWPLRHHHVADDRGDRSVPEYASGLPPLGNDLNQRRVNHLCHLDDQIRRRCESCGFPLIVQLAEPGSCRHQ
ncbi:MAG: hypothetical protein WBB07_02835 [Mycobacterium sp.]